MASFEIPEWKITSGDAAGRDSGAGTYCEIFGSWLRACEAAGLLQVLHQTSPYGKRCLARDGHECNSLAEKAVDDWLYSRGIEHEREPLYPFHITMNPTQMRADWKVGDRYVEMWGLIGDPEYESKIQRKLELAKYFNLELVELTPADIDDGLVKLAHSLSAVCR